MGQQNAFMQNEEAPTHVVGSQGRRGILPSAPGRPNPPAQGSAQSSKSLIPQKDADGKFPCPHCNKTYLHAKHLKRHLLRHTGDRPYMCHLCKDTFSRSDILKRHFQKCSIRRGNPTGANHLAHQRRNTNSGNRLSISQQDGPIGLAGMPEVAGNNYNGGMMASPTVNGDVSNRPSRANSLITPTNMSHRNSIAGLGILPSTAEQMGSSAGFQQGMSAYSMPGSSNGGAMQPSYAFNSQSMNGNVYNNQPSQMSFLGQQSSRFDNSQSNSPHQNSNGDGNGNQFDWKAVFSQSGQDGFIGSQPANVSSHNINQIKTEPEAMQGDMHNESFLGSLYSFPPSEYSEGDGGISGFPAWSLDDPLQAKVDNLVRYCEAMHGNPALPLVKSCLTVENVRHLAEQYTSWHGHWPILHMPTFKLTSAGDGLALAMLCIGAIYSPKLSMDQTRQIMEFVKARVMSSSSIYSRTINGQVEGLGTSAWEIEEFQALVMVQHMFTWHGEPHHRQAARNEFPTLARIAKTMRLHRTCPVGHYAYSVLHSGSSNHLTQAEVQNWTWQSWLEQEKRSRAFYLLFLTDAAMSIYFNGTPQFDPLDVQLMLPADDAAWDAGDAQECASALGLYGERAQSKNTNGTRHARQPGMRDAMRMLTEPNAIFAPGSTNAYSKFVLVHALITRIVSFQKTLLQPESFAPGVTSAFNGSTPVTPLSQNDWLEQRSGSAGLSASSSGHVTPTDSFIQGIQSPAAQNEKKRISYALDKWKVSNETAACQIGSIIMLILCAETLGPGHGYPVPSRSIASSTLRLQPRWRPLLLSGSQLPAIATPNRLGRIRRCAIQASHGAAQAHQGFCRRRQRNEGAGHWLRWRHR